MGGEGRGSETDGEHRNVVVKETVPSDDHKWVNVESAQVPIYRI